MMSKSRKWIITAVVMLIAGALICGISFGILGFNFRKLSTETYVRNTYDVNDKFRNITIRGDTENIIFVPAENEKCREF